MERTRSRFFDAREAPHARGWRRRLAAIAIAASVGTRGLPEAAIAAEVEHHEGSDVEKLTPSRPIPPPAGAIDYTLAGIGLAAFGAEMIFFQPHDPSPHWTAPNDFDDSMRKALRGGTPSTRNTAIDVSWVLLGATLGYPVVVDLPYAWARYGGRTAWNMLWQDAMVLSLGASTDLAIRDLSGRVRPAIEDCLRSGGPNCYAPNESTRSFPGGHVAVVASSATLICYQHLIYQIYGGPADTWTCVSAAGAALGVGMLRLVADEHWTSDILAGMALGAAFGWGLPALMQLRPEAHGTLDSHRPLAAIVPYPMTLPNGAGVGVMGIF